MIDVSNETKQAFLSDSKNKQLVIEFQGEEYDYDELNYFVGDNNDDGYYTYPHANKNEVIYNFPRTEGNKSFDLILNFSIGNVIDNNIQKCIDTKEIFKYDYWYFSTFLYAHPRYILIFSSQLSWDCYVELGYVENGVSKQIRYVITNDTEFSHFSNELYNGNARINFNIPKFCKHFDSNNYIDYIKFHSWAYVSSNTGWAISVSANKSMFTVSNTPPEDYIYPDYFESQIKDGVYPLRKTITNNITNENILSESLTYVDSICSQENIKFGLAESSYMKFSVADRLEDFKNTVFKASITCDNTDPIDLGQFKITEVKKKHSYNLLTQEITAYDNSIDWNKDVSDWFSKYLWGVNFKKDSTTDSLPYFSRTSKSWDFTRQMFSTFYNFAYFIGILNYDDADWQSVEIDTRDFEKNYYYYWGDTKSSIRQQRKCHRFAINVPDVSKLYSIGFKDKPIVYSENEGASVYRISEEDRWHFDNKDNQNTIGGASRGSIFIVETLSDNSYNKFVVDVGDCFVLSPNCTNIDIFFPSDNDDYPVPQHYPCYTIASSTYEYYMGVLPYVRCCDAPDWVLSLRNRATRLVYYDWEKTKYYDGGGTNVPCTIKDVLRSLFEINGAFVKIGRDGELKIKIPTKSILYPSETLYPSEDLYPAAEEQHQYVPMSKYISFEYEDYNTADFGQIQIKSKNSEGQTIKTYIGDENKESSYIIDNNIFYSNEFVKFDYDSSGNVSYDVIPEVLQMMKNLYIAIRGIDYRPHTTDLKGMPWIESGDRITLLTNQSAVESFVFRRTMKGIQSLRDTFEASGEDVIAMQDDNIKGE